MTVNALAPALITDTRMLPGEPEELRARVPVGRLGRPDEVADLALAILRNRVHDQPGRVARRRDAPALRRGAAGQRRDRAGVTIASSRATISSA